MGSTNLSGETAEREDGRTRWQNHRAHSQNTRKVCDDIAGKWTKKGRPCEEPQGTGAGNSRENRKEIYV